MTPSFLRRRARFRPASAWVSPPIISHRPFLISGTKSLLRTSLFWNSPSKPTSAADHEATGLFFASRRWSTVGYRMTPNSLLTTTRAGRRDLITSYPPDVNRSTTAYSSRTSTFLASVTAGIPRSWAMPMPTCTSSLANLREQAEMAQPSFAGLAPSRIVSEPRREHVQRLDLDRQLLAQRREVAPVDGHEQTADAHRTRRD